MKAKELAKASEVVRSVLADWRPYEWMSDDPSDPEFDGEIKGIAKQLERIRSEKDAAEAISRVFTSSFSEDPRFSMDRCRNAGALLWERLKEARLK